MTSLDVAPAAFGPYSRINVSAVGDWPWVAESFARKERSACKTRSACPRRAPFAEGHALALGGRRDM
jgi:hypothetical protein